MIYVKVQTASRARRPKPVYVRGEDWPDVLSKVDRAARFNAGRPREQRWHTVDMRTVSEAEYNRHTHPQLEGFTA